LRYWSIPCIVLTLHLQTHLFGSLKQDLKGRRFNMDQQLYVTVDLLLVSQPKTFYFEVIKEIVRWWPKCIVKQGDYVEILCSCKIVFLNMRLTVRINIDSPSYNNHVQQIVKRREPNGQQGKQCRKASEKWLCLSMMFLDAFIYTISTTF
jgi:hypothetical protein